MKTKFEFYGSSVMAGMMIGFVFASDVIAWWYLMAIPFLFSFEIKGCPWARLTYQTGEGWKWQSGKYR